MKTIPLMIVLCGVLLSACENKNCSDYIDFSGERAPFIHIVKEKENCVYLFQSHLWLEGTKSISEGEMLFKQDGIFLRIDGSNSSEVKYFDFSKMVGEEYQITFDRNSYDLNNAKSFSAQIEKIVPSVNGRDVFIFRISDAFQLLEDSLGLPDDLVFFVTRENGVIGSYISAFEGDVELVVSPAGNILQDVLDYSKKEFRHIE